MIIILPKEKKLKENIIYSGRILTLKNDLVELDDKRHASREIVLHNGGVGVLSVTETGKYILIKQFRYAFDEEIIEIPAGKLEKDEDHYQAAIRELKEETGISAKIWTYLGVTYPTVGYSNERIHLYLAEDLIFGEKSLDDDEFTEVIEIDSDLAVKMIKEQKIVDSKTIIAILRHKL